MPDLNYANPEVTAQMENVVRFWLEDVGVDGFRVDAAKHLFEEGNRPASFKNLPRRQWLCGFSSVTGLRSFPVHRHELPIPASLQGAFLVPLIGKEMLQRGQQEGTEATTGLVCSLKPMPSQ